MPPIKETDSMVHTRGKKRKLSFSSVLDSPRSSPVRNAHFTPSSSQESGSYVVDKGDVDVFSDVEDESEEEIDPWKDRNPVIQTRKATRGSPALLSNRLSGFRDRNNLRKFVDWREETSNFYTGPTDRHRCQSLSAQNLVLPFSVAGCHTNSLVAVGDEAGGVRLLDSAKADHVGLSQPYLSFNPHDNALMDLEFSYDDRLLATASGDQTVRITEMVSQREVYRLAGHTASVKRVQFQPSSNGNVLATCSRDGSIKLWDLRCSGGDVSALQLQPSAPIDGQAAADYRGPFVPVINTIREAHPRRPLNSRKTQAKREVVASQNDVSVTSIAFLQSGRDHLLASASEADACIKVWDMRTAYSSRANAALPVTTTRPPTSHDSYRHFGVSSMSFSSDFSRLYTACKDNTVYAYSTSHLVLGDAPEFTPNARHSARRFNGSNLSGLGPLYGFRHRRLLIESFYVKLSVRAVSTNNTEVLAVGSSDKCAVIFPTSESYLSSLPKSRSANKVSHHGYGMRPRSGLSRGTDIDPGLDTPIYEFGTALTDGVAKEVTGLSWTSEGCLTTISDDCQVRCWREDSNEARELRMSGGRGGRTWLSGWAEVAPTYDEDEG